MSVPPQLNTLFQQAVVNTTSERLRQHATAGRPISPERKQFLMDAIESLTYDVVKRMKELVQVLKTPSSSDDELIEALEGLQFECEQIDFAQDLHKIDGLGAVVHLLDHANPEVRMLAAWVLATCLNENLVVHQQARPFELLPKILSKLQTEQNEDALQKQLLCLSALSRSNPDFVGPFTSLEGYKTVSKLCAHPGARIRRKAVFFLFATLQQNPAPDLQLLVCDADLLPQLAQAVTLCAAEFDEDVFHQTLNILALLAPPTPALLDQCRGCGLSEALKKAEAAQPPAVRDHLRDLLAATASFFA